MPIRTLITLLLSTLIAISLAKTSLSATDAAIAASAAGVTPAA